MTNEDYLRHKEYIILDALDTIKKNGYDCRLLNMQNGHIQCLSKHGVKVNFYPTTGTIAGYDWEKISGLDALLQILENK